jgi:predicted XRE-type DNA-binding protein
MSHVKTKKAVAKIAPKKFSKTSVVKKRDNSRQLLDTSSTNLGIHESSGNVFADLGFPDAHEALAKSRLAQKIAAIVADKKLTQDKAAKLLGIDQPKVSKLIRGQLKDFSTDRLFHFLTALGQDVEITVKPKTTLDKPAVIRVLAA